MQYVMRCVIQTGCAAG